MRRPLYRRARHAIANDGAVRACKKALRGFLRWAYYRAFRPRNFCLIDRSKTIHPFDLAYHVATTGVIWGENLDALHANGSWSTAYYGIAPSVFDQAMEQLASQSGLNLSRFTFLDIGSGKGRALMLASRHPFLAIVGIEISPTLVRVARQNLASFSAPWQECRVIEIREGDAASMDLPATPLLIYLFNPFAAPVLEAFIQHLEKSLREHPREVWLLYFNPELRQVLARHPSFERQFLGMFPMRNEDAYADPFYKTEEVVAIYRCQPQ